LGFLRHAAELPVGYELHGFDQVAAFEFGGEMRERTGIGGRVAGGRDVVMLRKRGARGEW
jgi:hypothetical protein